ncbi:hypothetical protein P7C70_g8042, partial [Phenoliferia sp. Uapishka_3]
MALDAVHTRACFTALPLELKGSIIDMVSQSEENWRSRTNDWRDEDKSGHINALSAVALVNKELRELAARQQFRVVPSHRTMSKSFRSYILPQYAHCVEEVNMHESVLENDPDNDPDMTAHINTLFILHQLPALRVLTLSAHVAEKLFRTFNDDPELDTSLLDYDDSFGYHRDVLKRAGPRIEVLLLDFLSPSQAATIVPLYFPNLKRLSFTNLRCINEKKELEELEDMLGTLPFLTHLVIDAAQAGSALDGWRPDSMDVQRVHLPSIQYLSLCYFFLNAALLHFIEGFGATVETLWLSVLFDTPPHPPLRHLHLPSLRKLHLRQYKETSEAAFDPFLPFETATLSELSHIGSFDPPLLDQYVTPFLERQAGLQVIRLGTMVSPILPGPGRDWHEKFSGATPSCLANFTTFLRARALGTAVSDQPLFSPFGDGANLSYTDATMCHLSEALARALNFGQNEVNRMLAEGNVTKAIDWVEKLKPLELERLAWKD